MDASEHDVLACMTFPRRHRTRPHSIFRDDASIMRLIGTVLFERTDEWQTPSRSMMAETFARIDREEIAPIPGITAKAA